VAALSIEQPAWRQLCVSNELAKQGVSISGSGVRCSCGAARLGHDQAAAEGPSKSRSRRRGFILTEAQWRHWSELSRRKPPPASFESKCPGYCRHVLRRDAEQIRDLRDSRPVNPGIH
jgi:hypothetical protein